MLNVKNIDRGVLLLKEKNLKWLSLFTTILMLFVQIGGALVTKTGSADGCGSSWPLCHGKFYQLIFRKKH